MLHSAKKSCLFILLLIVSSFEITYSQTTPAHTKQEQTTRIKWTWQLPLQVRNAFYKSEYAGWYIEKIEKCNQKDKVMYKIYVNNGNILDGDHHDSYFKEDCIIVPSQEQVIHQ